MLKTLTEKLSKNRKEKSPQEILEARAFQPASWEPFKYLNQKGAKRAIDSNYEEALDKIFVLLRTFRIEGDIFEFGVFQGYTAKLFAEYLNKFRFHSASLHLFDSFEGIPEETGLDKNSYEFAENIWTKDSMAVPPGMEDYIEEKLGELLSPKRVHIIKGYYEKTLENYFKGYKEKARLVHIDCDLYSSSKFVLDFLLRNELIQDGTIFLCDDWMMSRGNPNLGQRKAFRDVLEAYPHWSFEHYLSYGLGSPAFIAHDLRVTDLRSSAEER